MIDEDDCLELFEEKVIEYRIKTGNIPDKETEEKLYLESHQEIVENKIDCAEYTYQDR